ncbi:MAG: 4-hydroxy-tetrahydrodipicolinate reductase [Bdellovibrionales bacterium]|nr:4-hydroxy-tetrahydrodipicolinate reductase [Bdellovibrionales bacterium]
MAGKKVVISGANGRMGQEIKNLVGESSVLSLGAEVDRQGPQTEFEGLSGSMDVVIDFSSPELFRCALAWAVASGTPFVSGTTGLENSDFDQLKTAAQKIPVLWAANMSLGVNFLLSLLPQLKALDGYDIQVEELHHNRKLDAPSGTAKILQNELVSSLGRELPDPVAIRGGGIFGIHKVWVMAEEEYLVLEHTALNRKIFARGAVRAAEWILGRPPRQYQIKDMLGLGV